jgi:hypothetical protein
MASHIASASSPETDERDAIAALERLQADVKTEAGPQAEGLVTDIYKAMVRARSRDAAVQVTLPGVIEPGAELVVKNESDQPIRVVADPYETLTLKTRERP